MQLTLEYIIGECQKNPPIYIAKATVIKKPNNHVVIEKKDV